MSTHACSSSNQPPLPKNWKRRVKSAVLSVVSLANYSIIRARATIDYTVDPITKLTAEIERLQKEISLQHEENRILRSRMEQILPQKRPQYKPVERMAILELRATRAWSLADTARTFLVTPETISSWFRRIDEEGDKILVKLREPINKFPQYVHYVMQRLKILCPAFGKSKIAQTLARAGLHLGTTTVGRMLNGDPADTNDYLEAKSKESENKKRIVTAKYPNHVWHTDLTIVPIGGRFWTAWLPFSLP